MLPLNPCSAYIRNPRFVREEWASYFAPHSGSHPAHRVPGGWRGILFGNLATVDPVAAWEFFAKEWFDPTWLDGGASRTWYLAFAAGEFCFFFFFFGSRGVGALGESVYDFFLKIIYKKDKSEFNQKYQRWLIRSFDGNSFRRGLMTRCFWGLFC